MSFAPYTIGYGFIVERATVTRWIREDTPMSYLDPDGDQYFGGLLATLRADRATHADNPIICARLDVMIEELVGILTNE